MVQTSHSPKPATPPPGPIHPLSQAPKAQGKPTEPAEVRGRHKNTGKKDHKGPKGAR